MAFSGAVPIWLYAHPTMEPVAKAIVQRCSETAVEAPPPSPAAALQRQNSMRVRRTVEFRQKIRWDRFKDGFPNLFIEDVKEMAGKDVIFLASFHSPEVFFEQLSIIYAIPRYLAKSFTVILPYFPTGTMERVDTEGQIATAKTLATLLSGTPFTSRGPSQVMIFDIHALQERFYFSDTVIPRLESAIPLLQIELAKLQGPIAIAFPDEGAFKRFHSMFPEDSNVIVCTKIRDGRKRYVKIRDGNVTGNHVVIVDDLVQTGGTLIECAKVLLAGGASKISAYVTHPVFPAESWRKFTDHKDVAFDSFWITDSVPHATSIAQHAPFKLLSLSTAIASILLGYDLRQV